MLYEIKEQFSMEMISDEEGPHISLYQPTHRHFKENKQDVIVFKNLLREIVTSLKQNNDSSFIDSIMEPLYKLEQDSEFWKNTFGGIAVLANQKKCIVYKLTGAIKEFAVVSNRFHIKPLIKAFQSVENYQLLLLSKSDFSVYQGNRYGFSEVEIDSDIPRTLVDVLGKQLTEPSVNQGSYAGAGKQGAFYGLGDNKVEEDKDTEKYFRYVDQYVFEHHSKISKLPLILVSVKAHHTPFKKKSHNTYFIEENIDCSYDLMDTEQLQLKAFEVIKSLELEKTEKMIASFKLAEAELMGSSDLDEIAKAAYESKIETVLIEEDKIIWGNVDEDTGKIKIGEVDNPDFGDILDSLAESVLKKGGKAVIVSKDEMPSTSGIAAIYRYI